MKQSLLTLLGALALLSFGDNFVAGQDDYGEEAPAESEAADDGEDAGDDESSDVTAAAVEALNPRLCKPLKAEDIDEFKDCQMQAKAAKKAAKKAAREAKKAAKLEAKEAKARAAAGEDEEDDGEDAPA